MKTLKIDDKWSVQYDPENNDRPVLVLRYGHPSCKVEGWKNYTTAMFYALLEARESEDITKIKYLVSDDRFVATFLNALADRIHASNVAAGWWTDITTSESTLHSRNVPEMLMLTVSELSEALEAHRKNLMDDHLPHRPGLQTELADAVIRILDLAGSRTAIEREHYAEEDPMAREARLAQYGADKGDVLNPIGDIFVEKVAYNAQRADHKIENRLKDGGKKI